MKHDPVLSRNLSQMKDDEFLWCLHCERVYLKKEIIADHEGFKLCPYDDCNGSAVLDGWDYLKFKDNDRFPNVPEKNISYPLYD